jgi:hypothetical protein
VGRNSHLRVASLAQHLPHFWHSRVHSFFGFNFTSDFVVACFTDWMLLGLVGNVGILACGLWGYRSSLKRSELKFTQVEAAARLGLI